MKIEKIGSRIAGLMKQRGISLDDLVERTGLHREFLGQIGHEKEYFPSLGPLLKISRALGVRLGTLLDDQVSEDPLIVRKGEQKKEIDMLPDKDKPVALKFFSLGRGKTDRHMEPFFIEILPESAQEKKLSTHEGEEFIVVTEGEVEVLYGTETHLLKAGDSIYYNSVVPHYVSCASQTPACIYAVLYIPD
ncbi:helix-turn-helix domain-containing protein [Desulfoluna spongiiphila]|uniref:Cro/C1-type HTH DNA-binding domain-containing protein n=1 Tax=Desulfoluna spongiiphila TaxID=419481 RepID=A0A1G5BS31_9BACT|nr:cupin domain-containing protein [Desulfoluna spongiiphila]SCX92896.1 Cro/C1-type HTH DNA-binding domain-containing protein [Desulfoluna spongiiphila]VVS93879.1 rmlc-like jelly roll fold [Desulfoluna spongiiphila]